MTHSEMGRSRPVMGRVCQQQHHPGRAADDERGASERGLGQTPFLTRVNTQPAARCPVLWVFHLPPSLEARSHPSADGGPRADLCKMSAPLPIL